MRSKKNIMKTYTHVVHPFAPIYDSRSEILILGSLPSVASRKNGFYYGNPQNRFWKVLSLVFACPLPVTVEEKTEMLLEHRVAIWDVIGSCDIKGSSDSSICNVTVTDIPKLIKESNIERIYANGGKAEECYRKFAQESVGMEITKLLSTSPANCRYSVEELAEEWKVIKTRK
jgi:hypoxanthine-DNA glycosylase